ncbi:hypothetical protein ACFS07_19200 [Undibacterium arcticum]
MTTSRTMNTIALLQKNSLPSLVQKELERMILAGDLVAGDKLNEVTLAEMLGGLPRAGTGGFFAHWKKSAWCSRKKIVAFFCPSYFAGAG